MPSAAAPRFVLSPDAAADLEEIAAYTLETFGLKQARLYRAALRKTIETVARNPYLGSDQSHLRPGYRRRNHGSHAIFYVIADDRILVLRILHGAQDPLRHLPKE